MHKKNRKMKQIPVRKIIPNMITSGSVFCGLSSLIMTYHEHLIPAALLICFAVFFDFMDGRVARSLGGSSSFGEELDSLADAISFGVAPAFLMYVAYVGPRGGIAGVLATAFFALCGVLRLARFNVTHVPVGPFQGLPIPAGGLTLAACVISKLPMSPKFAIVLMCFVGALMISSLPYCNAKKLKKSNINKAKSGTVLALTVFSFITLKEKAFLLLSLVYIASGLIRFDASAWIVDHAVEENKD